MNKGYVKAVCPFYQSEYRTGVVCEGFDKADACAVRFRDTPTRDDFEARFCFGFAYEKCPIAAALERLYAFDDE